MTVQEARERYEKSMQELGPKPFYIPPIGLSALVTIWEYKVVTTLMTKEEEVLKEMGLQGWELCTNVSEPFNFSKRHITFYFKRPKQ
jgi:hypothetical protein